MNTRLAIPVLAAVAAFLQTPNIVAQTSRSNHAPVALMRSAVAAQTTNPPYLSEMPAADRVMREIQGADPSDNAIRQIGAFWQLIEIIKDMAWGLGHRFYGIKGQLLPDEERIWADYGAAYSRIWQSRPELKSQSDFIAALHGYDVNPKLRAELLDRFFSQNFRTQYYKANAKAEAEYRAWVQSRSDEAARVQAQNRAPAQPNSQGTGLPPTDDPGTLAARRCVAAGRDPIECMKEALGKTFGEIVPGAKKTSLPSGLRLNGIYPGSGGFNLTFGPAAAAVTCGRLEPAGHTYTVGTNGNQILVTMQNDPKPIVLAFRQDGKLVGPGPTDIKGQVVVGYKTEQRSTRKDDGRYETYSVSVPIFEPRTERCNVGVLASTGAANPVGLDAALGTKIFDATARQMANSQEIKATPGLRMNGVYAEQGGLSIEFHNESAVVECRDAVIARPYTVDNTGSQVTIQHSPQPIVLTLGRDGRLTGSGAIQVAGRVVVGMSPDNQVLYAPKTDTCTLGILTPDSAGSASTSTSGEPGGAPASTPPNVPAARPNNFPTPKNATSSGAAVLSIRSGFPTPPGTATKAVGNPLGLLPLRLYKESFENTLAKAGFQVPPGTSPVTAIGRACRTRTPECQSAVAGLNSHIAMVQSDFDGNAQFPSLSAGTYYLVVTTRYNNQDLLWNVRVDLKPGANSVTLDQRNGTPY